MYNVIWLSLVLIQAIDQEKELDFKDSSSVAMRLNAAKSSLTPRKSGLLPELSAPEM